jgi:hypothetical protein
MIRPVLGSGLFEQESTMFWTGFFIGFAACLAIALTGHVVHDRRQRAAFVASLSPAERKRFTGFEKIRGDWHEFRDLLHTHAREAPAENYCRENAAIGPYPAQTQERERVVVPRR